MPHISSNVINQPSVVTILATAVKETWVHFSSLLVFNQVLVSVAFGCKVLFKCLFFFDAWLLVSGLFQVNCDCQMLEFWSLALHLLLKLLDFVNLSVELLLHLFK